MRSAAHSPTPSPPKPALCRATHPLSARVALRHALRAAGLTTLMTLLITPMTLPITPMIMLITPRTLLITLMTMIVQVFGMNNGMFVAPYASDACNTEAMAGQCPVSVSCGGSRDAGTPCKLAESRVPSSLYNVIGPDTIHWTADSIKTPYTWGFPDRFTEAETSRGIKLWYTITPCALPCGYCIAYGHAARDHYALRTAHFSFLTDSSLITHHSSLITYRLSLISYHLTRAARHIPLIATQVSTDVGIRSSVWRRPTDSN